MASALMRASVAAGSLCLVAGGLAYAAFYPTSQIFGEVLVAGRDPREIALTYDDGPNPSATPPLLDLLARRGVRATFFLIGRFVRQQPALAREIAAAGHVIGNHTMTHPKLAWQSAARVRSELREANAAIEDAIGAGVRYMRPPHGARRPYVLQAARAMGLCPVQWNITAHDWSPIGIDAIHSNISRGLSRNQRAGRGSNVLLHDGGHLRLNAPRMDTVRATEMLLDETDADRFVTVDAWDRRGMAGA